MMLIIAGILFFIAMLLLVIDKLADQANINLEWPVRVLVIAALLLILLSWIMK